MCKHVKAVQALSPISEREIVAHLESSCAWCKTEKNPYRSTYLVGFVSLEYLVGVLEERDERLFKGTYKPNPEDLDIAGELLLGKQVF